MGLEQSRPAIVPVSVPVTLHIYDMGTDPEVQAMNRMLKALGTGAFHVGAEIYGREWSFRGKRTAEEGTGVFWCRPRMCRGHTYHDSVHAGICHMTEDAVFKLINLLQAEWPGAGAAISDVGEYLEERSMTLATGMATTIRGVKDDLVKECKEHLTVDCSDVGCISNGGCMADIGSIPSLCEQSAQPAYSIPSLCVQSATPAYRTFSNNPEYVDAVPHNSLVQELLPSCAPPLDGPGPPARSVPSVRRSEEKPPQGSRNVRAQIVPRSRTGVSHARYMPQEVPRAPVRPPSIFDQDEPVVNRW